MTINEYAKVLQKLMDSVDEDQQDIALDLFMQLILKKKVLSKIDFIIRRYKELSDESEGYRNMEVTLVDDSHLEIKDKLSKLFGQKVSYNFKIDPSIIGGVIIRDGNIIYDASIKTQLNKLKLFLN